jgi:hypothetical protein
VTYVRHRAVAIAEATVLLVPGRRIVFRNIDTGEWSELSTETVIILSANPVNVPGRNRAMSKSSAAQMNRNSVFGMMSSSSCA